MTFEILGSGATVIGMLELLSTMHPAFGTLLDLTGDGMPDLVVVNEVESLSVLRGMGQSAPTSACRRFPHARLAGAAGHAKARRMSSYDAIVPVSWARLTEVVLPA